MKIKSFKQFLNEFELEGEPQGNKLHYILKKWSEDPNRAVNIDHSLFRIRFYKDIHAFEIKEDDYFKSITISIAEGKFDGINIKSQIIWHPTELDKIYNYFKQINENDVARGTYSKESEWDNKYKHSNKTTLLYSNNGYNVYRATPYVYFLVDSEDDYLGQLTLNDDWVGRDSIQIYNVDAKDSVKGFYKMMLPILFKNIPNLKIIYSDSYLSNSAINAYNRLNQDPQFNIQIKDMMENKLIDFDPNLMKNSKNNLVAIQLEYK